MRIMNARRIDWEEGIDSHDLENIEQIRETLEKLNNTISSYLKLQRKSKKKYARMSFILKSNTKKTQNSNINLIELPFTF